MTAAGETTPGRTPNEWHNDVVVVESEAPAYIKYGGVTRADRANITHPDRFRGRKLPPFQAD